MNAEDAPRPNTTGKTAGDVLDGILSNPKRWLALLGLFAGMCGLVMLVLYVFMRLFGVQAKELRLGSASSHVLFESVEKGTGNAEYVVIVSPQGWQKTSIEVHPDERLSFQANGKICVDVHEVINNVNQRLEYENGIAEREHIRRNDVNEKRVPEDYFTPEQRQSLILRRPWVDPGGFDLSKYEPAFRSRRGRYLLPDENAAGLIAAVSVAPENKSPAVSDAFFVGRSKEDYTASHAGWLWFTVNDVQNNDPQNPNLFYNDNVGSFWVRVVVKHG